MSAKTAALDPNPHSAVYIAARREWNERYGDYIAQARNWRLVAFGMLGVTALSVAGNVWQASQSHVVPYIVQTDKLGDALAISRADVATPADPRLIRAQLARWVSNVRSIYVDVAAEKRLVTEAYAMVDRNAVGSQALNDWFSQNDPFKRAQNETVAVAVQSVLPLSGNTWRVEWREDKRTRQGGLESTQFWQATITISVNPPTDDATILINPTGVYIQSFDWSQRGERMCDGRPCP